jgi:hypothetical protein
MNVVGVAVRQIKRKRILYGMTKMNELIEKSKRVYSEKMSKSVHYVPEPVIPVIPKVVEPPKPTVLENVEPLIESKPKRTFSFKRK